MRKHVFPLLVKKEKKKSLVDLKCQNLLEKFFWTSKSISLILHWKTLTMEVSICNPYIIIVPKNCPVMGRSISQEAFVCDKIIWGIVTFLHCPSFEVTGLQVTELPAQVCLNNKVTCGSAHQKSRVVRHAKSNSEPQTMFLSIFCHHQYWTMCGSKWQWWLDRVIVP